MFRRPLLTLLIAATAAAALPAAAHADSAPDAGAAFVPSPVSQPLYGTKAPSEDPATQEHVVEGHDGTDLYVETWLPAPKDGRTPPARVPVVLVMTPYVAKGQHEYESYTKFFTERGYAVAQHHVRGTGESGGCLEQTSANQIDDGARVVEYLGRDAPFSDGNVGMFGVSYDAETQVSVAGLGDPAKTKWLKAMIPIASVGGQYEYSFMDGVPYPGFALQSNAGYLALVSLPNSSPGPNFIEKLNCQPEVMSSSADQNGDMTPFWKAREYRPGAPNVKAATLYVHGLRDFNVLPITVAGWFDRLPDSTPHKGLFGVWPHSFPDGGSVEPDWRRTDWQPMALAWFDRYLKGFAQANVEAWPDVQVQDSAGQWRAEPEFPSTGGPVGQLALGPDGTLGGSTPTGESAYTEGMSEDDGSVAFTTPALPDRLHLTGQPVLDLWLTTSDGDGHISARIEVLDAAGEVMTHPGEQVVTGGARSVQHLDPMPDNYFQQESGQPAPANEAIRVPVRFQPTDLVVPAGGKLRVVVGGGVTYGGRQFQDSGLRPTITLLHDCEHASALRFLMPHPAAPLVNGAEEDDPAPRGSAAKAGVADGAGLASARVCGAAPERLPAFGPERAPSSWGTAAAPPNPPGAGCRDTTPGAIQRVKATIRRRSVSIRGQAFDAGCSGIARVQVAVGRVSGKRCRFVTAKGRFGKSRACAKPSFLKVKGTFDWALAIKRARLSKGRYVVIARVVDAAGNVSPLSTSRKRVR